MNLINTLNPQVSSTAKLNFTPLLGMPVCRQRQACFSTLTTCLRLYWQMTNAMFAYLKPALPPLLTLFFVFYGVRDFT